MVNDKSQSTLVTLRKKVGITQKELAEALGVTDHTIRNWEKGREEPRLFIWQVKAMCELLQCSLDDLPDTFKKQTAERGDDTFGGH